MSRPAHILADTLFEYLKKNIVLFLETFSSPKKLWKNKLDKFRINVLCFQSINIFLAKLNMHAYAYTYVYMCIHMVVVYVHIRSYKCAYDISAYGRDLFLQYIVFLFIPLPAFCVFFLQWYLHRFWRRYFWLFFAILLPYIGKYWQNWTIMAKFEISKILATFWWVFVQN